MRSTDSGVDALASVDACFRFCCISAACWTPQQSKPAYLVMIQQDPILQSFIFFSIAYSQQIAQCVNLQLVEILVNGRVQQALELDNAGADFCGRCFFCCGCLCCCVCWSLRGCVAGGICLGRRKAKLFFGYIEKRSFDFADGLVAEFVDGVDNVVQQCLRRVSTASRPDIQSANPPEAYSGSAQSAAPS